MSLAKWQEGGTSKGSFVSRPWGARCERASRRLLGSWRTSGSTENGKEYLGSSSSSLITLPTLQITESLSLMLPTLGKPHRPPSPLPWLSYLSTIIRPLLFYLFFIREKNIFIIFKLTLPSFIGTFFHVFNVYLFRVATSQEKIFWQRSQGI